MNWLNALVWPIVVAFCALFWLGVASAFAQVDPGGYLIDYDHFWIFNERVAISGLCESACTMKLGSTHVCIYTDATLAFHAGVQRPGGPPYRPASNWVLATYLWPHPGIGRWVRAHHALDQLTFTYMTGREAIALGVPSCI